MQTDTIASLKEDFEGHKIWQGEQISSNPLKRLFDICFALLGLALSSPVQLLLLAAVVIESAGNPIYVQKRVGRNGKIFNIYKLRTMYAGTDSDGFKTAKDDRRLTAVGKLLRATNIDELPQLVNVLNGDMSLIGPRPLSVDETNYIARHLDISSSHPGFLPTARPGLVGLEQVNRDKEMTYLERFQYNHCYEANWTPILDCQIFIQALLICRHVCIASIIGGLTILAGVMLSLNVFR